MRPASWAVAACTLRADIDSCFLEIEDASTEGAGAVSLSVETDAAGTDGSRVGLVWGFDEVEEDGSTASPAGGAVLDVDAGVTRCNCDVDAAVSKSGGGCSRSKRDDDANAMGISTVRHTEAGERISRRDDLELLGGGPRLGVREFGARDGVGERRRDRVERDHGRRGDARGGEACASSAGARACGTSRALSTEPEAEGLCRCEARLVDSRRGGRQRRVTRVVSGVRFVSGIPICLRADSRHPVEERAEP